MTKTARKVLDKITSSNRKRKEVNQVADQLIDFMKSLEGQAIMQALKVKNQDITIAIRENGVNDIHIIFNGHGTVQKTIGKTTIYNFFPHRINFIGDDKCISQTLISPRKFFSWAVNFGTFKKAAEVLDYIIQESHKYA